MYSCIFIYLWKQCYVGALFDLAVEQPQRNDTKTKKIICSCRKACSEYAWNAHNLALRRKYCVHVRKRYSRNDRVTVKNTSVITWILTWSGFEAAKTAPWPSRGLNHFGKFLETSDEWAGRGCCCFLMRWHSWAFLVHQEWVPEMYRA